MRKLLGVTAIATIAIAVAACSGKSSGSSNKVTGTIGGNTFTPKSGSFDVLPEGPTNVATVGFLSDDPDFCANATATTATILANHQAMVFLMGNATSTSSFGPATTPGAYTVVDISGPIAFPAKFFGGEYAMIDNSCNTPNLVFLTTAGTPSVNLTTVNTSAIDGKGTGLKWSTGDSTDVSFALKSCPGLAALLGNGPSICKQ